MLIFNQAVVLLFVDLLMLFCRSFPFQPYQIIPLMLPPVFVLGIIVGFMEYEQTIVTRANGMPWGYQGFPGNS